MIMTSIKKIFAGRYEATTDEPGITIKIKKVGSRWEATAWEDGWPTGEAKVDYSSLRQAKKFATSDMKFQDLAPFGWTG